MQRVRITTIKHPSEATTIGTVTLREAGRRLGKTPEYVKGAAEAKGIVLTPVGAALVMSEADFRKLARSLGRREWATAAS